MIQTMPRMEHPNPQKYRDNWINLNGEWEFEFDFGDSGKDRKWFETSNFTQKIIVPFCPESKLSGIGYTDFINAVWYKKEVEITKKQLEGITLLHFGAVDYHTEVWINGTWCGEHNGGYVSFELDITKALIEGENTIVVYAKDDLRSGKQPRGKQSGNYFSQGCDYTRTTGIWQTVWLEFVAKEYIKDFKVTTNRKEGKAYFKVNTLGDSEEMCLKILISYGGKQVGGATSKVVGSYTEVEVKVDEVHLWDVGQGYLYDVTLQLVRTESVVDEVSSYFGIREIEWKNKAMYLNGKPVYQRLVLDQGFYPEGIYTAPTDEALKNDIEISMALGFNGARLHEKVFEKRYIYWADRLGYLVWGEQANWGLDITSAEGIKHFLPEWLEAINRDFNHPAIVGWCPFNETWDASNGARQDDEVLRTIYLVTKALDPTRPVIDTSGNFHVITDIFDIHDYEQDPTLFAKKFETMKNDGETYNTFPHRQQYEGQPYFVSEYGGTWWNPEAKGEESWGYGNRPHTEEEVVARYVGLTEVLLDNPNICAFCYTQIYDVEQEQNGLYTYSRAPKFSKETYEKIKQVNTKKAAIEY
ncbi:MAG: glycoside hydrolase family 2 protein [Cellulosilyticaceae bacterium]